MCCFKGKGRKKYKNYCGVEQEEIINNDNDKGRKQLKIRNLIECVTGKKEGRKKLKMEIINGMKAAENEEINDI